MGLLIACQQDPKYCLKEMSVPLNIVYEILFTIMSIVYKQWVKIFLNCPIIGLRNSSANSHVVKFKGGLFQIF